MISLLFLTGLFFKLVEEGLFFLVILRLAGVCECAQQIFLLFCQILRHLDVDLYAQIAA